MSAVVLQALRTVRGSCLKENLYTGILVKWDIEMHHIVDQILHPVLTVTKCEKKGEIHVGCILHNVLQ